MRLLRLALGTWIATLGVASAVRAQDGEIGTAYGGEITHGVHDSTAPLDGLAVGVSIPVYLMLLDEIGIGGRFEYRVGGDRGADTDGDGEDDNDSSNFKAFFLSASTRIVLSTAPGTTQREAWLAEIGLGWMAVLDDVAPSGTYVEMGIGRRAGENESASGGGYVGNDVGFTLRWQHGIGDAAGYDALMLSWSFMHETSVDSSTTSSAGLSWLPYTIGAQLSIIGVGAREGIGGGVIPGFGVSFGIPLGRMISTRARGDFMWFEGPGEADDRYAYSAAAGLRLRLTPDTPLFAEIDGGYAWAFGTQPRPFESGPILDMSLGVHIGFCRAGLDIGARWVQGVGAQSNGDRLSAIFAFIGGEYGSWPGATGSQPLVETESCDYIPPEPEPPTPPVYTPTPTPPATPRPPDPIHRRYDPNAPRELHVELPPSLLLAEGPVVPVSPAYLPMSELRIASAVTIEITCPQRAFAYAQQALQLTLQRYAIPVIGISHREGRASDMRARLTFSPSIPAPQIPIE